MSRVTLASGLTLSYSDQGDAGDPVVLLLPGPTDSWRSYEMVLDRLPDGVRAIAVSLRGQGGSDKPETGYAVQDFAADVVALLDALDVERAVLTGHSASCLVARRVAIDHPDRVTGLILEASPTTLRGNAMLADFVESVVSSLSDPIDPDFARSFVLSTSSATVAPEVVDVLVGEVLRVPARVWRETFSGLLRYSDLDELERVTAPTLLIWGDADKLVNREMQRRLALSIRRAELLVYARAGHTPRWDLPARFSNDLATFVRSVGVDI